jgi:DNA-binding response OmpR family regulator
MRTPSVLVVDGDPQYREGLAEDLARLGIEASVCSGTSAARGLMRQKEFACAVVDVVIDEGDGLEAVGEIRETAPTTPIVVTAAENTRELEARVRDLDVLFYHVKGFNREELLEAVREALGGRAVREKILVIDDDPDYQEAIKAFLESGGYTVVAAFSKEEGMAKVKSEDPDVIILDIMMDRLTDGFHFLYEMRSAPEAEKTPVLAVTAVSERMGFDFAPEKDGDYFPADDYMAKPVKAEELLRRVRRLLEHGT